jgi:methyl-accepting chemotaxis protein
MQSTNNQRKLRNYLFSSKTQMTLGVSNLILLLLMFGTVILTILSPLYTIIFQSSDIYVQHMSSKVFLLMLERSAIAFVFLLFVLALHQIFFVHKICGPLVSFKHTLDKLHVGDFTRRVNLRRKDFFKQEATQVNEMLENVSNLVLALRDHQNRISADLDRASQDTAMSNDLAAILADVSEQVLAANEELSKLNVLEPNN